MGRGVALSMVRMLPGTTKDGNGLAKPGNGDGAYAIGNGCC